MTENSQLILPDHLSHSSLSAFDCPKKGYHLVIKREDHGATLSLVLGHVFHHLTATTFFFQQWELERTLCYWSYVFDSEIKQTRLWEKKPSDEEVTRAKKTGEEMIRGLFDVHRHLLIPPMLDAEGPLVERQFTFDLGFPVVVVIDLVVELSGKVTVVDWKTSKSLPKEEDDLRVSSYKDQLELYALGLKVKYDLEVDELKLIFSRLKQEVRHRPTIEGGERQRERVRRVVNLFSEFKKHDCTEEAAGEVFKEFIHAETCTFCPLQHDCDGPDHLVKSPSEDKMRDFQKSLLRKP
jgi:hypothetical protein